jgi:hypothetical protein
LHVVHRVLLRLLPSQGDVQVEGLILRTHDRKKRAASTPMASMSSARVTISPRRVDICRSSPSSSRFTSCPMITSSTPGRPASISTAAFIRGT